MKRSFLPCWWLVCALVMGGPAFAQKIVLNIDGNWWDSSGQALGFASRVNGPCVFGDGGTLQIADADTKAAQAFAFDQMPVSCASSCKGRPPGISSRAHCQDATEQAIAKVTEAATVVAGVDLHQLFLRLFRNPQLYVVAAARGLEDEPEEAVLLIEESEVDLSPALQTLPAGTYTVSLEPIEGGAPRSARGKVEWQPPKSAKVSFAAVTPGLYRLTAGLEDGDSEGSQTWVVLSPPAHYDADEKKFRAAIALTRSWSDRVDTSGKRAVLRAALRSLTDGSVGK